MKRDGDCKEQYVWGMRGQIRLPLRHFLGQVKLCTSFQTPDRKAAAALAPVSPPRSPPRGRSPGLELHCGRWARSPPARTSPGSIEQTRAAANGQALISGSVAESWRVMCLRTGGEAGCGGHRAGPLPPCPWHPGLLAPRPPSHSRRVRTARLSGLMQAHPVPPALPPQAGPPEILKYADSTFILSNIWTL